MRCPFYVHITDADQSYLDSLPLSDAAKRRIRDFAETQLGSLPDEFRLDPANRPYPGGPYFYVRHIIKDRDGNGKLHAIDFYIQDDRAAMGVLLVVFIDHYR